MRLSEKWFEYRFGGESDRYTASREAETLLFRPLWGPRVCASGTFRTVSIERKPLVNSRSSEPDHRAPGIGYLISAVVLILLVQFGYAVFVFYRFSAMETRGQFGDLFGGLNALFTGLAFAGLIYTIFLQRRDLELQRDELRLTREELHNSTEAQKDQASQLKKTVDLNALTALLNIYIAELQPLRDSTRQLRAELAERRAWHKRKEANMEPDQKSESISTIKSIERQITDQEAEWETLLYKHNSIAQELEDIVKPDFRELYPLKVGG